MLKSKDWMPNGKEQSKGDATCNWKSIYSAKEVATS